MGFFGLVRKRARGVRPSRWSGEFSGLTDGDRWRSYSDVGRAASRCCQPVRDVEGMIFEVMESRTVPEMTWGEGGTVAPVVLNLDRRTTQLTVARQQVGWRAIFMY